jgi:hypothetical protein
MALTPTSTDTIQSGLHQGSNTGKSLRQATRGDSDGSEGLVAEAAVTNGMSLFFAVTFVFDITTVLVVAVPVHWSATEGSSVTLWNTIDGSMSCLFDIVNILTAGWSAIAEINTSAWK